MIYLVSNNQLLFKSTKYEIINFKEAMDILSPLSIIQLDSETEGLDCHTKKLLTLQLGSTKNQVVFDWASLSKDNRNEIKELLESDKLFLGHNLMFDLTFLYKQNIWPKHIYDTMIAEQLIYLGYPKIVTEELWNEIGGIPIPYEKIISEETSRPSYYELSMSLKATAKRRIEINIDKTVRGTIINEGLTERVVQYASGDVMWLELIRDKQLEELKKQDLILAAEFESEFVKSLAYCKYCGIHLNAEKWKAKMDSDFAKLEKARKELNEWVIKWDSQRIKESDWDIQIPELEYSTPAELSEAVRKLIKDGYELSPKDDLEVPYQSEKLHAYKKKIKNIFTEVDPQGDLFEGFSKEPKCKVKWSSSRDVVRLFETIGIDVNTFDKKTKRKKKSIEEKQIAPQKDKFSIIPIFLQYQEAAKVVSTYGQNWLNAINPVTDRIHVEIHSIGTDTSRVSSGGGPYKLNMQNLPNDETTRSCFTAEKGNKWLSCDYSSQESRLLASVSKDKAMIDLFENGCKDVHSLVAYMSYPNIIPRETKIEDIKKLYHKARQDAKGIEFAVNYGGDANTIASNKSIRIKEAQEIYDNYMKGFPGVKEYQDYCRKIVMQKGYILMNPIIKHRAHIYDSEWMLKMQEKFKEDGFWEYYREMKQDAPSCDTVQAVKRYFKRKSESEKQSINYRMNVCDLR